MFHLGYFGVFFFGFGFQEKREDILGERKVVM
jgi:hypothetical protein